MTVTVPVSSFILFNCTLAYLQKESELSKLTDRVTDALATSIRTHSLLCSVRARSYTYTKANRPNMQCHASLGNLYNSTVILLMGYFYWIFPFAHYSFWNALRLMSQPVMPVSVAGCSYIPTEGRPLNSTSCN